MKRSIITTVILLMATIAMAGPVGKQQARLQAQNFFSQRGTSITGEVRYAPGQPAATDHQPLYVFNANAGKGFVIVAGDDRAASILGYVDQGSYDERHLPDNFRDWLVRVADEINSLPQSPKQQGAQSPMMVAQHSAIQPLIQTKWNQGSSTETGYIYNTLTPTIDSKHTLTGCVATAGAQLMYYYQYPQKATKVVPQYESNATLGVLAALPAIKFNWAAMKTVYTKADVGTNSEKAVSQLMKYCGYAAEMDYGLDGSAANVVTLSKGMVDYFDYDPYTWQYVNRSSYTISAWDELIYNELKAKRPVIFSGSGDQGGHAYLCDGYKEGFYHFNWGWGGQYNGYFKLNATNPYNGDTVYNDGKVDNGFALSVGAIIGLQPNTGTTPSGTSSGDDEWEEPVITGIVATARDASVDGTVIKAQLQNGNDNAACLALGIGELNSNGTVTALDTQYDYFQSWELPSGSWWTSYLEFDVSTYNLAKGKHTLVFISKEKDASGWVRARPASLYYDVNVTNSGITIVQHPVVDLQITDFTCISARQPNSSQTMTFKVKNMGDNYKGYFCLFASTTTDKGSPRDYTNIQILSGNTKERTLSFKADQAGTYNVWLTTDWSGENVVAQTTVKVERNLQMTKMTFTGNKFANSLQPVDVTVKSTGNEYGLPLYLFASTSSSNKGSFRYSVNAAIEEGQSDTYTFYFKPLSAGNYMVWICTDEEGRNVVGQGNVTIAATPTYEISLSKVSISIDAQPNGSATLRVKNNSTNDYFEQLQANLFIMTDNQYSYVTTINLPPTLIKAGATQDVVFPFDGLEAGYNYYIVFYYKKKVGGSFTNMCEADFSFTSNVPTGIVTHTPTDGGQETWFTLGGQRLTTPPTAPGIYLKNGRKVVVK